MRSANAPTISAGVMAANVIWKQMIDQFRDPDADREGAAYEIGCYAREEHLSRSPPI